MPHQSKNILFTSTYFYPYLSGLTDYLLKVAKQLAKKHRVAVVTFQYNKSLALVENYGKIRIYRIPVQLKVLKGLWSLGYPLTILKYVRESDIVFVNLPQFEGMWPAFWGRLWGKNVFAIYNCELAFGKGLFWRLAAFVANLSAFFTCLVSHQIITYTKDYAQASLILRFLFYKTQAVLPPVEKVPMSKNYFYLLKKRVAKAGPVVGFSGRIAREKGLEYLIESLALLIKKFPKIVLVVAGPFGKKVVGEEKYYLKIKKIIDKTKVKVIFLGALSKEKLSAFYKVLDVLVLPSVNKTEAFGMVQVEAMRWGTPVISSNLPGMRVPVRLTKMGLLAKAEDSTDLAKKIKRVLDKPDKFRTPLKKVVNIFKAEKSFEFYEELVSNQ